MISFAFILKTIKRAIIFVFIGCFEHETEEASGCFFLSAVVKRIQDSNILSMLLVHVLTSCVSVSLTRDVILPCHKATRLAMCLG